METKSNPQRPKCRLCNNLERRYSPTLVTALQRRVAFDFTILELSEAANESSCRYCLLILKSLEDFTDELGKIHSSIAYVYACGSSQDMNRTLTLEVYSNEDTRRKLQFEVCVLTKTSKFIEPSQYQPLTYARAEDLSLEKPIRNVKTAFQFVHPLSQSTLARVQL